ncbi:hypothetical protein CDAR_84901 [Caerostris darwini]|uniref:Uncharacterized protein n=1 Tax=Caerostris darwini TaxID=1538125 RepID=A0AAV4PNW3_9ARAC|nr:hypothetical protein CDAR_84901 [Caerostris darwini]
MKHELRHPLQKGRREFKVHLIKSFKRLSLPLLIQIKIQQNRRNQNHIFFQETPFPNPSKHLEAAKVPPKRNHTEPKIVIEKKNLSNLREASPSRKRIAGQLQTDEIHISDKTP